MELLRGLSVLWSLFHVLVLFNLLYHSRFSRRVTVAATCLAMGPLVVIMTWLVLRYGPDTAGKLILPLCTVPSVLFYYIMSADRGGRYFFTFCLADTVSCWVIIVSHLLDVYLAAGQCILMFIVRLLFFPAAEFVVFRYLRKPYLEVQGYVPSGWWVFTGMGVLYYLLLVIMSAFPVIITKRPGEIPAMILVLCLMPLTYLTIFGALHRQFLLFQSRQSESLLAAQKEQIALRLENQQTIRRLHHDMKAHFNTLNGLLSEGNLDDARSYLAEIGEPPESHLADYCGDPCLNAVLNQFLPRFAALGVSFRPKVSMGDRSGTRMELCLILSNALENMLDALAAMPPVQRAASLQIRHKEPYLLIRAKNRCANPSAEAGNLPHSTKKETGHGYGLVTIRDTAEKLGGSMSCYVKDGWFVLDVAVKE